TVREVERVTVGDVRIVELVPVGDPAEKPPGEQQAEKDFRRPGRGGGSGRRLRVRFHERPGRIHETPRGPAVEGRRRTVPRIPARAREPADITRVANVVERLAPPSTAPERDGHDGIR